MRQRDFLQVQDTVEAAGGAADGGRGCLGGEWTWRAGGGAAEGLTLVEIIGSFLALLSSRLSKDEEAVAPFNGSLRTSSLLN